MGCGEPRARPRTGRKNTKRNGRRKFRYRGAQFIPIEELRNRVGEVPNNRPIMTVLSQR